MELIDFISTYDRPGMVVLLEGKRVVLPADVEKLVTLGRRLTEASRHMLFRSGNASGADAFFAQGVVSVDASRFQAVVPYDGHRTANNHAGQTVSLDGIDLASEPDVVYESRQHRKTAALVDKYVAGQRDRFAIKAAYILRDTVKVLGAAGLPAAGFAIFYDDLSDPGQGGTGHTMQVCRRNNVPLIDQGVWFEWVR
jgi:hypothetical protein